MHFISPCFPAGAPDKEAAVKCVTAKLEAKHIAESDQAALKVVAHLLSSVSDEEIAERAGPALAAALEEAFAHTVKLEATRYIPEVLERARQLAQNAAIHAVDEAAPQVALKTAYHALRLSCTHTLAAVAQYSVKFVTDLMGPSSEPFAARVANEKLVTPKSLDYCTLLGSKVIQTTAKMAVNDVKKQDVLQQAWGPEVQHAANIAIHTAIDRIVAGERELWRGRIQIAVENGLRKARGTPVKIAFPTPIPLTPSQRLAAQDAKSKAERACLARVNTNDIMQQMACKIGASAADTAMETIPTVIDSAFRILGIHPPGPAPAPAYGPSPAPGTLAFDVTAGAPAAASGLQLRGVAR